ncbi:MAG: hypothetical protein JEZ10_07730 [Verrucomicrobia bacterium]|nr:hypothetical protein [Verrucomicrobiota bacterium]
MSKKVPLRETARNAFILIVAAILWAGGVNMVHPKRISWVEDWGNRVEAQAVRENIALVQLSEVIRVLREDSRLLVDARPVADYARSHLPGAVSLPFEAMAMHPEVIVQVLSSPGAPVLYCSGPECDDSLLLALELRKLGRADVAVFIGGMELWRSELLAVEEGAAQ